MHLGTWKVRRQINKQERADFFLKKEVSSYRRRGVRLCGSKSREGAGLRFKQRK